MGSLNDLSTRSRRLPPEVLYRCVCGHEFQVDSQVGGVCPTCHRAVAGEAIQFSMAATLSVSDLRSQWPLIGGAPPLPDDPMTGRQLSHFRLDQCIGKGGMGAVYRALDTSLERYVAVKVLHGGGSSHANETERVTALLQEAIAQARLNHPHVVTIYYVGRHENEPFLAMELVAGETLAELGQNGVIPYARLVRIAQQVASALEHARQFGIVHGDIKPSNLLCSSDLDIKLSDFGLSRFDALNVVGNALAGTPAYLAPELLEGQSPNIQSDMFALGVTLFELTFGNRPYTLVGQSLPGWIQSIKNSPIDYPQLWPRDIPHEWQQVLDRLLAYDPNDRYPDYPSLVNDLRRLSPVSSLDAGFVQRMTAYVLDQAVLLACLSPFALGMLALTQAPFLELYRWLQPIVAAASLIVPSLYLLWIRNGRKTFGRYLFQLRVVDEHGLALPRGDRLTREFFRNMFAWLTPLAAYVGLYFPLADRIIDGGLILFLSADCASLFLRSDRRTLHDLLCRSRVVLDNPER